MVDNISERSIETFDVKRHDRESFACGVESLDQYFRSRARQDRDKYAAAVFVMAEGPGVIGYYTLSSYTINPGELPDELACKLPRYPNLPATLIGRLAVDRRYQRKGFGEELLLDALKRCFATTSEAGSLAVVVEAENAKAIQFYQSYGFIQFPDHGDKLFLPMPTIRAMFEK
ncbi:MAG: GNAT family N-acetyltransferase [Bryobacteraceae bacterium]